ncbi:MAG TPA: hypothetical protein VED63_13295 [Acidimicrobiales bacterium]|nr:hypothetical protein [Acidimicrobiales bacterium]
MGIRYGNFHTTALCSPTRASLLTGRNATSNGMATIAEISSGFPGISTRIPFENGFLSEVLVERGLEHPDKPFFSYLSPQAGHAPHHAPEEWIDRNQGRFDMGYEAIRPGIFAWAIKARSGFESDAEAAMVEGELGA